MKSKPLQLGGKICNEKHFLTRDQKGGRKRRLLQEVSSCYSSKPAGEPDIDCKRVDEFREELNKSKASYLVIKSIYLRQSAQFDVLMQRLDNVLQKLICS